MSEQNVEVVKRSVEAYLRGDIDAYLKELGDDAELDFSRARGPYRGVHRGREGARELFAGFREAFSSITPLSTEYMEVGDKVVLAARVRFRGRASGVEVGGGGVGAVYTLRDGKIVRYEQFQSKAEALEAPGCRSQPRLRPRSGRLGPACNLRRSAERWIIQRSLVRTKEEERMPLIEARLLEGVFSTDEREQLAEGLINAVVGVKGESFRSETEVLIAEVPVGNWYERGVRIVPEGVGK